MTQAVSRCPLTAKTRFRSPVSPFKNRVGRRGTGTGSVFLLQVLRYSPVSIVPPKLHSHLRLHVAVTRTGGSLGKFRKQTSFENRGSLDRKVLSSF